MPGILAYRRGSVPLRTLWRRRQECWSAYLTNYVYWTGLAFGAFLLSPVLVLTNATWGRPIKRLSESVVFFLPGFVHFALASFFRKEKTRSGGVLHPEKQKAPWLNTPFFFTREGIGLLLLLYLLQRSLLTRSSVKRDVEYKSRGTTGDTVDRRWSGKCPFNGLTSSSTNSFIMTLVSFDMIMSLNPGVVQHAFRCLLLRGFILCGACVFGRCVALLPLRRWAWATLSKKKQFHDLGKLLFAFCVVSLDFFYVQFLVIWYGNLPDETRYVIWRVIYDPWAALAWTVLIVLFIVPFLILVFRKVKLEPVLLASISIWILIGIWLEKFLLVTPSMLKSKSLPLGIFEVLITLGWLGLFGFCVCSFLQKYPVLAVSDPMLAVALEPEKEKVRLA